MAYPTDTLYGLGVDPRHAAAVERLFQTKGRDAAAGIPLVAADAAQIETYLGELPSAARHLADTFWPGPLTLVITAHVSLSRRLTGGRDTVAVRVPNHAVARSLPAGLGHPITATSANLSGQPAATTGAEAVAALGPKLGLVLDAGRAQETTPSTIVDVRGDEPVLLRPGAVAWDRVLQSLS